MTPHERRPKKDSSNRNEDVRAYSPREKEAAGAVGGSTRRIRNPGDGFSGGAWVGGHPATGREENRFSTLTLAAG